ncbi:MAG TPA: cellulose synthase family protein [Syntrophobacteraceae bacterium]|nr:cellulose synthase family protein [Syntrophobacteraceae bacterium]
MWTTLHFTAMALLSLYGLHRLWLLACWSVERKRPVKAPPSAGLGKAPPIVTVQLPLYNERFVAARLINAVARLDWPGEKLEIQVLDDSTDVTGKIVDELADHWRKKGVNMKVIRRAHRAGYKAGALKNGLMQSAGEYVAIFDADFVPPRDFLIRTAPCFTDERIGMVQARWGFLNTGHSWLTRVQSLLLGPHFSIEHWVRFRKGLFFNFNGTAGIWRKKAIDSSGGWQSDTVTEDLDLSFRAQLAGWRFIYLEDLVVPSELPVTLAAFRSQQRRWAKGSMQTARKILPALLASRLSVSIKIEAVATLLANFCWLLGALISLTVYPTIISRVGIGPYDLFRIDLPLILCTSVAILFYFLIYWLNSESKFSGLCLLLLPIFSIGLAPCLALSVLEGVFSRGGVFERTPKFGMRRRSRLPFSPLAYRQHRFFFILFNTALLAYGLMPIFFASDRGTWAAIPFLLLFPLGYLTMIVNDLRE